MATFRTVLPMTTMSRLRHRTLSVHHRLALVSTDKLYMVGAVSTPSATRSAAASLGAQGQPGAVQGEPHRGGDRLAVPPVGGEEAVPASSEGGERRSRFDHVDDWSLRIRGHIGTMQALTPSVHSQSGHIGPY